MKTKSSLHNVIDKMIIHSFQLLFYMYVRRTTYISRKTRVKNQIHFDTLSDLPPSGLNVFLIGKKGRNRTFQINLIR